MGARGRCVMYEPQLPDWSNLEDKAYDDYFYPPDADEEDDAEEEDDDR